MSEFGPAGPGSYVTSYGGTVHHTVYCEHLTLTDALAPAAAEQLGLALIRAASHARAVLDAERAAREALEMELAQAEAYAIADELRAQQAAIEGEMRDRAAHCYEF